MKLKTNKTLTKKNQGKKLEIKEQESNWKK
jgi:hypothetical protein